MVASGQCAAAAAKLSSRRRRSLIAEIFAVPGTIGLMPTKWCDICLGAMTTLISVQ
jgi:hypothetical protein